MRGFSEHKEKNLKELLIDVLEINGDSFDDIESLHIIVTGDDEKSLKLENYTLDECEGLLVYTHNFVYIKVTNAIDDFSRIIPVPRNNPEYVCYGNYVV